MARLTAPNGASVTVADAKVDNLLRRGFVAKQEKAEPKKAAPRKRAAKKSE